MRHITIDIGQVIVQPKPSASSSKRRHKPSAKLSVSSESDWTGRHLASSARRVRTRSTGWS